MNIKDIKLKYPYLFNEQICNICNKKFMLSRAQIHKRVYKIENNQQILNGCSTSCISKLQMKKYGSPFANEDIKRKIKDKFLKKYGSKIFFNTKQFKEKVKNTFLQKYGVCYPLKSKKIRDKIKQTNLKKYGTEVIFKSAEFKHKRKMILLEKYGVDNYNKTKEFKDKMHNLFKNKEFINKRTLKTKRTVLNKYGVDSFAKTKEFKDRYKDSKFIKNMKQKEYVTKRKNNSFNTSQPEDRCYNLLKTKFTDVERNYRSDLYPFNCDFYIPSIDLYIELNFHWTHGKEPFNKNNIKHIEKLNLWKAKNTKFYDNAIKVWVTKDVNKLECFKENNLNYKVFYNENEFIKWFLTF